MSRGDIQGECLTPVCLSVLPTVNGHQTAATPATEARVGDVGRPAGGLDVIGHPSSLRPPTARSRELFGAPSRLIVSVPLNNRIAKRFVGRYCPRRNRILT